MGNNKMIKTAAAVALGASVVATSVAPGAASAATTYKLKSGKLVNAKTGKAVKGYKVYKSTLYKDGKKAKGFVTSGKVLYKEGKAYTGLRSSKYYKAGKLATGTYKSVYYKTGVKFTGLKSGVYYKAGVKGTGVYKSVYYKAGKKGTALVGGVYYENGAKGTGSYKGIEYKSGKAVTGVVNDVYYNNGVKATAVVEGVQYVDGDIANEVYKGVLYVAGKAAQGEVEGVLYEDGKKVTDTVGGVIYEDGKVFSGVKDGKVYLDGKLDEEAPAIEVEAAQTVAYGATAPTAASLVKSVTDNSGEKIEATATITFDGKEVSAIDTKVAGEYTINYVAVDKNGNEGKASVKVTVEAATTAEVESVTALNGKTIEVKFSKAVDETAAKAVAAAGATNAGESTVVTLEGAKLTAPTLSEDGKTLTFTAEGATTGSAIVADKAKLVVNEVLVKGSTTEKTAKYTTLFTYKDTVAPTLVSAKAALVKVTDTTTNTVTVSFSEAVQTTAFATINGETVSVSQGNNKNELTLTSTKTYKAGDVLEIKLTNVKDIANNATEVNPLTVSTTVEAANNVAPTITSVVTKGSDKVEVTFDKEVDGLTIKNTAYLSNNGVKVATLTGGQVSADDAKVVTYEVSDLSGVTAFSSLFTEKTPTVSATLFIPAKEAKDTSANEFANDYSSTVTFTKDFVKPTIVSSTVVDNKLVLTYSEAVKLNSTKLGSDFTLAATNLVTGNTQPVASFALDTTPTTGNTVVSKDGKTVTIDLNSKADATEETSFVVAYTADLITDESGNAAAAYTNTITLAKQITAQAPSVTDKLAPVITVNATTGFITAAAVTAATGSEYSFTYTIQDNTALDFASIRNLNNYSFAGQPLPTGTTITTDAQTATTTDPVEVTITIPKKSVTNTLTGVLTISGIKDAAGNSIAGILTTDTAVGSQYTLKEGIAPTLTGAKVNTDGTITLTLSEEVDVNSENFQVFVGASTTPVDGATAEITTGSDKGKLLFTPKTVTDITNATGVITVKTIEDTTAGATQTKDASENILTFATTVTATK